MDREEARHWLGVNDAATAEEVRVAYVKTTDYLAELLAPPERSALEKFLASAPVD